MNELLDRFLESQRLERNASPHTLKAYATDLAAFLHFLENDYFEHPVKPKDLDHHAIRAWLGALAKAGRERSSIARKLSAVRSLLKFLCREGVLDKNAGRMVATPKLPRKLPGHLTVDETFALMEGPSEADLGLRDRCAFELSTALGFALPRSAAFSSMTSICARAWCGCWARGARNAS